MHTLDQETEEMILDMSVTEKNTVIWTLEALHELVSLDRNDWSINC